MSGDAGRPGARPVGRSSRALDLAALLLLSGGAALYMYAQHRAGRIAAGRMPFETLAGEGGGWNMAAVDRLVMLSRTGLGLAIAGVVAGLASFLRHTFLRPPASIHEQADDSRPS